MIIFDLEWNRGYDKTPLDEILQIGAVRMDRLGGRVTDTFNIFICPRVHKKFSPGAKELPELSASLASGVDFPAAFAAFRRWCGEETEFASWGGDDFLTLRKSCAYWGVPFPTLPKMYDLQTAFAAAAGTRQQIALHRAVEYCGIPDTFTFHNALNDALYTAILGEWVPALSLALHITDPAARKRPSFCSLPYPPQPRLRLGPEASPGTLLNAKKSRRAACPLCGQAAWIQQWYAVRGRFYAMFRCPAHGRFPCRLTLSQGEDGQWRGRLAVPEITPELLLEFQAAMNTGKKYVCHTSGRKRKRRRRTRGRSAARNQA